MCHLVFPSRLQTFYVTTHVMNIRLHLSQSPSNILCDYTCLEHSASFVPVPFKHNICHSVSRVPFKHKVLWTVTWILLLVCGKLSKFPSLKLGLGQIIALYCFACCQEFCLSLNVCFSFLIHLIFQQFFFQYKATYIISSESNFYLWSDQLCFSHNIIFATRTGTSRLVS